MSDFMESIVSDFKNAQEVLTSKDDTFIDFNKRLNYLDSWKDSTAGTPIRTIVKGKTKNQFFETTLDYLYNSRLNKGFRPQLEELIDTIDDKYGPQQYYKCTFIETMTKSELNKGNKKNKNSSIIEETNPYITKLPNNIKYVIHDSGYNPLQHFSKIVSCAINPGSYIDPGKRSNLSEKKCTLEGYDIEITQEMFNKMGFPHIKGFIGVKKDNDELECTLKLDSGIEFISIRTKDFEHKYGSTKFKLNGTPIELDIKDDFFKGNTIKNKFFNDNFNQKFSLISFMQVPIDPIILKGLLYALCKELGDTLQVLYMYISCGGKPTPDFCMFTSDKTVLARCKMLSISCCIQDNYLNKIIPADNVGDILYWSPEIVDIIKSENQLSLTSCFEENAKLIKSIVNLIGVNNLIKTHNVYNYNHNIVLDVNNNNITINFPHNQIQTINGISSSNGEGKFKILNQDGHFDMYEIKAIENNEIINFLNKIISAIIAAQYKLSIMDLNTDNRRFNKTSKEAIALKFISEAEITYEIETLFVLESDAPFITLKSDNNTFIRVYHIGKHISGLCKDNAELIIPTVNSIPQQGGLGENQAPQENSFMQDFYYTIIKIAKTQYTGPLNSQYNELIEHISYSFLCTMTIYLNYIKYSCLNESVLTHFFKEIIINKKQYTLDEFKTDFYNLDIIKREYILSNIQKYYFKAIVNKRIEEYDNILRNDFVIGPAIGLTILDECIHKLDEYYFPEEEYEPLKISNVILRGLKDIDFENTVNKNQNVMNAEARIDTPRPKPQNAMNAETGIVTPRPQPQNAMNTEILLRTPQITRKKLPKLSAKEQLYVQNRTKNRRINHSVSLRKDKRNLIQLDKRKSHLSEIYQQQNPMIGGTRKNRKNKTNKRKTRKIKNKK